MGAEIRNSRVIYFKTLDSDSDHYPMTLTRIMTLRVITLEIKIMKGNFTDSPISEWILLQYMGHFETGMTGIISDSSHQLMTLDSDSLFKNLRNELRVKSHDS